MIIKIKKNKGFVILFAVTLSSIMLAIALGVADIAFRELRFSTSAKDTNEAFFAADTGAEYVLYKDRSDTPTNYPAPAVGSSGSWNVILANLNATDGNCAMVTITKDNVTPPMQTTIVSKGYNIGDAACASSSPNRVERELKTTYGGPSSPLNTAWALINAGGGSYTNTKGTWSDIGYSGGSSYSVSDSISGTSDQPLYQTQRYGNHSYTIGSLTPNTTYTVILKFAEIYQTVAGIRMFNVSINGNPVLTNFDIFQEAGGHDIAIDKTFSATSNSSGQIIIQFTTVQDNAAINAIEIDGSP